MIKASGTIYKRFAMNACTLGNFLNLIQCVIVCGELMAAAADEMPLSNIIHPIRNERFIYQMGGKLAHQRNGNETWTMRRRLKGSGSNDEIFPLGQSSCATDFFAALKWKGNGIYVIYKCELNAQNRWIQIKKCVLRELSQWWLGLSAL